MLDQFFELPVIGLLFMAALIPLIVAVVPALRSQPAIAQWCGAHLREAEKGLSTTILIACAFIVGMLANQMVDAFDDWLPGGGEVKCEYKTWVAAHEREVPLPPPTLKLAEVQLADASEYTRMYVVRHRMIIRVVRSAAAAAALALLAMAIHEWVANLAATPRRYGPAAFTAVAVMLALFVAADVSEHESVSKRVFELTKYRHAEAVLGRACPPAR